jgi:hypothetical protein
MEIKDGVALDRYHTTISNVWKLDNEASTYFTTGIYGLDIARPDLFIVPGVGPYPEDTNDYSGTSSNLGSYWSSIFDTLGESVGLSGKWLAGIAFFVISTIAVIVVRSKTNESPISVLACIPVMWAGTMFGVPMFLAGIASAVAVFFLFRDMVLARS